MKEILQLNKAYILFGNGTKPFTCKHTVDEDMDILPFLFPKKHSCLYHALFAYILHIIYIRKQFKRLYKFHCMCLVSLVILLRNLNIAVIFIQNDKKSILLDVARSFYKGQHVNHL